MENKPKPPVVQPVPGHAIAAKQRRTDKEALQKLLDLQRLKMDLYNKQIEQQTGLLKKIQATENKEIKKKFMALVKKTEESTKATKNEIEELNKQIATRQEVFKQSQNLKWVKKNDNNSSDNDKNGSKDNNQELKNGNNETHSEENNLSNFFKSLKAKIIESNKNTKRQILNNKKRYLVVMVYGCPLEHNTELIKHMEKFGELFDFDINSRSVSSPCIFTYKKIADAQRVGYYFNFKIIQIFLIKFLAK